MAPQAMLQNAIGNLQNQLKTVQSNVQATRSSLIAGRSGAGVGGNGGILSRFQMGSGKGGILGFGILPSLGGMPAGNGNGNGTGNGNGVDVTDTTTQDTTPAQPSTPSGASFTII